MEKSTLCQCVSPCKIKIGGEMRCFICKKSLYEKLPNEIKILNLANDNPVNKITMMECPKCQKKVSKTELSMFGGLCQWCSGALDY